MVRAALRRVAVHVGAGSARARHVWIALALLSCEDLPNAPTSTVTLTPSAGALAQRRVPVDTPLAGVLVQLIVTPIDSIRGKYFDRLATAGQGQYFFFGVPTTGHYELEAFNVVIRDFPDTISAGFIQDIGTRCVLPSRDGRIPLSRRHQRVLIDKGLL